MNKEQTESLIELLESSVALLRGSLKADAPTVITGEVVEVSGASLVVRFTLIEPRSLAVRYGTSPDLMIHNTKTEDKKLVLHIQRPAILGSDTYYQAYDPYDETFHSEVFHYAATEKILGQVPLGKFEAGMDTYGGSQ